MSSCRYCCLLPLCRVTLQYSLTNICSLSSTLVKLPVNLELPKISNDIGEDEQAIATETLSFLWVVVLVTEL